MTKVADYVVHRYDQVEAGKFLSGADPWLVAHAYAYGGTVVTFEKLVPPESGKPKIPNVCAHFNVDCMDLFDMLQSIRFSF